MRVIALAVVAVATAAGSAAGQDPVPAVGPGGFYPDDGLRTTRPAADPGPWRVDLVAGLPVALRVQRRVTERGWVEGGAAAWGPIPAGFVGLRCDGGVYEGRRNQLLVRPGVDAYYSPIRGGGGYLFPKFEGFGVVTADVEFVWQRQWSDRFQGTCGLKIGCGAGFLGDAVFPLPTAGLLLGCQF